MTLGYISSKVAECPLCHCRHIALENFKVEAIIRCTGCGLTLRRPHRGVTDSGIQAVLAAWNKRSQASPSFASSVEDESRDPDMLQKHILDLEQQLAATQDSLRAQVSKTL